MEITQGSWGFQGRVSWTGQGGDRTVGTAGGGEMARAWTKVRTGALVVAALGVVLAAPLAPSGNDDSQGDTVVISGARTLSDQVEVSYGGGGHGRRTTDLHVLAFNDLHGTLDPAGNNLYGHFAGGAAFLSKAIHDRQALYRGRSATVFAGDNIGASPLANSLFHEEPAVIASNLMRVDFASVCTSEF